MNLVVVDIDQLKTIINDAVTAAMKQHHAPEQQDEILRKVEVAKELKVSLKKLRSINLQLLESPSFQTLDRAYLMRHVLGSATALRTG